jgi:hypothetical protein
MVDALIDQRLIDRLPDLSECRQRAQRPRRS